jgi:hypothetical protein
MHFIFEAFPFLSNQNVEPDELHVVHLGTSQCLLGSVLWLLVHRRLRGSPAENMAKVWGQVSRFYTEARIPTQYSTLHLSFFHDPKSPAGSYPRLKGKGAEVKGLVPALRFCWSNYKSSSEEDQWVQECLDLQCSVQELVDSSAPLMFLAPGEARLLLALVERFLVLYSRLGRAADGRGDLLWAMVPKFHWLWHWAWRAQYLHPRRGACMTDEDFVGRLKEVAKACTHSTPLHRVPVSIVAKYRCGTAMMKAARGFDA